MINAKLLQLAVDASQDGIVIAEQEGDDTIIIYANPAFEHLTGYQLEGILYQDCRFLQKNNTAQPELELIRDAIKNHESCRAVLRNYRQDGTLFWNELSITPVFNNADNLMYFIGIQKDVSATIQAQQRINALEAELIHLKQQLSSQKATD